MGVTATDLLIVGAGPYGLAVAGAARDAGLDPVVLGRPMAFWREHMPEGMALRSGPDWHLDVTERLTLERYLAQRGLEGDAIDPIPISAFLDYCDWFREQARIDVDTRYVETLEHDGARFTATLVDGSQVVAEQVVAAPGIAHFAARPEWSATLPHGLAEHTVDVTDFAGLDGARVLVVGGRQSAYEWAALVAEAGAARVDVVHRHPEPAFDRVSWAFVDGHMRSTEATPGWWKTLSDDERAAIAQQFWEVGRLTLEHWLTPRLPADRVVRHADATVTGVQPHAAGARVRIENGGGPQELDVDRIVLATGYKADLARVPYLRGVLDRVEVTDGFPVLDAHMQTTLPGLFVPGFAATRDFGPFFGFVRGATVAARLVIAGLTSRRASGSPVMDRSTGRSAS